MFYRSRRVPADAAITLIISGLKLTVMLLDVSKTGLKLRLDQPFPKGTKVKILAARLEITGEIRWASGGEAGVALDHALDRSDLAEMAGIAWAA